jgi:hypothetical protein
MLSVSVSVSHSYAASLQERQDMNTTNRWLCPIQPLTNGTWGLCLYPRIFLAYIFVNPILQIYFR